MISIEDFYILLTGSLVAICCAIPGTFLHLRKMAMVSDAISHAVLPGIVIAYLATGLRDSFTMLIGAVLIGVFSTLLIEFLHKKAGLQSDASIGITFTWLFALGVIMLTAYAGQVDLDQDCVLYGEIALVPFDTLILSNGLEIGPRDAYIMLGVLVLLLIFVIIAWKELMITTFDASFADINGFKTQLWNQALMALVSITTVTAFESVGAILVVALMVVPPAAAYLLTNKLLPMLLLSCVLGVIAAIGGYYLAVALNSSIAGAMTIVAGLELVLAIGYSKTSLKVAV